MNKVEPIQSENDLNGFKKILKKLKMTDWPKRWSLQGRTSLIGKKYSGDQNASGLNIELLKKCLNACSIR